VNLNQWMQLVFPGTVAKMFGFIYYTERMTVLQSAKFLYDAGLAELLMLKVGAIPTLKEHKSELQLMSETFKCLCQVGIRHMNAF